MIATLTVISVTPLRSGDTTGILTFVNERGLPGTAKIWLGDGFVVGEQVEVELYERRREGINVPETWAKRMAASSAPSSCLVRAAVDLVMHSTPPGLGVDVNQIRSVMAALEVGLVSPR